MSSNRVAFIGHCLVPGATHQSSLASPRRMPAGVGISKGMHDLQLLGKADTGRDVYSGRERLQQHLGIDPSPQLAGQRRSVRTPDKGGSEGYASSQAATYKA